MKQQCCICKMTYGHIPPLDDERVTDGYCDSCYETEIAALRERYGKPKHEDEDDEKS